ncbi:unnamed protein product [Arctogadus glacialis]
MDEVQFFHFDSNTQRIVPKPAWVDQLTRDDPDYLERETGYLPQTPVRPGQVRLPGPAVLHTHAHVDPHHQREAGEHPRPHEAVTLQRVFSRSRSCVSVLSSPERPRVSLLQRSPSSPVACHATGFYPDRVVVFWRRDGQELHEQVDPGEVLPNHDGTFQVSVDLDLKAVPQEDWGRYECVVQLRGIEDISTPLDPALIRTNGGKTGVGGDGGGEHMSHHLHLTSSQPLPGVPGHC